MPPLTRRRVLEVMAEGVAGLSLGASLLTARKASAQTAGGLLRLEDDLYVLREGPTNVVALTDADGVVLVDGGAAAQSEALLAAIAGLPGGGSIRTLFNTHWHREQTGLNEHVGRAGATIIAQENTRLWTTTAVTWPWDGTRFEPLPEIAQPNETFYDRGVRREGGKSVEYGYIRQAPHTDGDLYVHFPHANVLVVGDAVSSAGWPLVDWWTGGWMGGLVGGLELLVSLTDADTRIVPARGEVLGSDDLRTHHAMYGAVFERLAELLYGGHGPEEAVAARPAEEFEARMGPSDAFVRQAFESMWAYLSPDA